MESLSTLIAAMALFGYAVLARRLDRWWISMPMAMVGVGLLIGPLGLGLVETALGAHEIKTLAELTLALMLFHDAVRIDLRSLRQGRAVPLRLLGIGLPVMIVLGTGVAYVLFPELGLVGAALVATMLAPTDAALGAAVVSDERVPVQIRQGLNVESGLNDGLSVPIFLVLLSMLSDPESIKQGALLTELVRQIGFGIVSGVLIGGVGGVLMRLAASRNLDDPFWRRIATAGVAVGCFVGAAVLGGSGFIGAFVGGIAFGFTSRMRSPEDNIVTEYVGSLFDALSFMVFGAVLLPYVLKDFSGRVIAYAVLSLVGIRMISVVIAMVRSKASWPTLAFMGWFGPRGLATLVFAVLVFDEQIAQGELVVAVAAAGITLSVIAHGFSAPPLVQLYSDWWHRQSEAGVAAMETTPVHDNPTGIGAASRSSRLRRST